ncbi:MAG: AI-2E family transporter [Clostridiaceae bacterium]
MSNLKEISYKRLLLTVLAIIIFYLLISNGSVWDKTAQAIKPIFEAFVIAYFLEYGVRFFQKKFKLSRKKCIAITVVSFLLIIIFLGLISIPSMVSTLTDNIMSLQKNITNNYSKFDDLAIFKNPVVLNIYEYLQTQIETMVSKVAELSNYLLTFVITNIVSLTSGIFNFILAFVIAIYMLLSREELLNMNKKFIYAFLPKEVAEFFTKVIHEADRIFSQFFIGKVIDSIIIGLLCYIIMVILRVPNSALIAVIIGVTNIIPYFGPIIGAIPSILITLLVSPIKALWVLIAIVALQQFDGIFLGPKILGDKIGVDAFWIITGVTMGGAAFGLPGMILGVPMIILIKDVIDETVEKRMKKKQTKDCTEK